MLINADYLKQDETFAPGPELLFQKVVLIMKRRSLSLFISVYLLLRLLTAGIRPID